MQYLPARTELLVEWTFEYWGAERFLMTPLSGNFNFPWWLFLAKIKVLSKVLLTDSEYKIIYRDVENVGNKSRQGVKNKTCYTASEILNFHNLPENSGLK